MEITGNGGTRRSCQDDVCGFFLFSAPGCFQRGFLCVRTVLGVVSSVCVLCYGRECGDGGGGGGKHPSGAAVRKSHQQEGEKYNKMMGELLELLRRGMRRARARCSSPQLVSSSLPQYPRRAVPFLKQTSRPTQHNPHST